MVEMHSARAVSLTIYRIQWARSSVIGYMKFFLGQQIAEARFVLRMREEVQTSSNQIAQLNALIAEMEVDYVVQYVPFDVFDAYVTFSSLAKVFLVECEVFGVYVTVCSLAKFNFVYMGPFFILDKLAEVAESPRLVDKMKYVFGQSRGEDESFGVLMRDLCFALRISLSKKRRLVAELEAVGEVEGAAKCLEHMRVVVARDAVTLGELETLLARAQVGVSLKSGFVADMELQ
ncbi:hypothetical protein Tco_0024570 [Tanacetum coccineum]